MPKSKTYFAQVRVAAVQQALEEETAQMGKAGQPKTKKKSIGSSNHNNGAPKKRPLKDAQ